MIASKTKFSYLKIEDETPKKETKLNKESNRSQTPNIQNGVKNKKKKAKSLLIPAKEDEPEFVSLESQIIAEVEDFPPIREEAFTTILGKKKGNKKKNALSLSQFCSLDNTSADFTKMGKWTSEKPLSFKLTPTLLDNKVNYKNAIPSNRNKLSTEASKNMVDGIEFSEILLLTKENSEIKTQLLEYEVEQKILKKQMIDLGDKNAKLTILFENAQMKEKAELMIQIEELLSIHNDLSKEFYDAKISELSADLEREKSKTHQADSLVKALQQQLSDIHVGSTNSHHHLSSASTNFATSHHSLDQAHHIGSSSIAATNVHKYQRGHIK